MQKLYKIHIPVPATSDQMMLGELEDSSLGREFFPLQHRVYNSIPAMWLVLPNNAKYYRV